MPIRTRLTAWYVLLLAAIIAGLGGFVVVQLRSDLRAVIDRELRARGELLVTEFEEEVADEATPGGVRADFDDLCETAAPGPGTAAALLDRGGAVLASCRDPRVQPAVPAADREAVAAGAGPRLVTTAAVRGEDEWRAGLRPLPGGGAVVVAESLRETDKAVDRVLTLLVLAGPAALLATALGGWQLARHALGPVVRMTQRAREIGIDRLGERVPVTANGDEIAELGMTLNAMLQRLEEGLEDKHRLIADTSHEMRTPLAVMRAELDVTLRGEELPDAAREVLESAREEVDRMSRTVDNLLALAQVDEGRLGLLMTTFDLRQAIDAAVGALRALAAAKDVRIEVTGSAPEVTADFQRVQQALVNFVENAIKFTREGGVVQVTAWASGDEAGVTVTDEGPGVPAHAGEQVFERFYRAHAGAGSPTGTGLGLALCREVAIAHGGRVWVERTAAGGSSFSLALPQPAGARD